MPRPVKQEIYGLMSGRSLAKYLDMSYTFIMKLAQDDIIPSIKIGDARRFDPVIIMLLLKSGRIQARIESQTDNDHNVKLRQKLNKLTARCDRLKRDRHNIKKKYANIVKVLNSNGYIVEYGKLKKTFSR